MDRNISLPPVCDNNIFIADLTLYRPCGYAGEVFLANLGLNNVQTW